MNKQIRIIENGIEKETIDTYCKKVKLSKVMDAKQLENLMKKTEEQMRNT